MAPTQTPPGLDASLDNLPLGVMILRRDYTVRLWNRCLEQWTGLSAKELIGRDIRERFPLLGRAALAGRLDQVFQSGAPAIFSSQLHRYIIPVARPDGSFRRQHTVVSAAPDPEGEGFHAIFTVQDVTDLTDLAVQLRQARDRALSEVAARNETEEALRRAKEESERILRVVPSAIFTVDDRKRILSWNSRAEDLTGYAAHEVVGSLCSEFALAPCLIKCGLLAEDVPKPVIGAECSIKRKDGQIRLLRKNVDVIKDQEGRVIGGIESFEDITEQRQAEFALSETEERYRVAIEASNDGVVLQREGIVLFANARMATMLGFQTARELVGLDITDFVHPKYRAQVHAYSARREAGLDAPNHFELIGLRRGGEKFPIEISAALTAFQGRPVTLGFVRDITERKRAEEELVKLSRAVEQSLASVVITNQDGAMEYVNDKFCQITGYTREEALGQNPRILKSDLMGPEVYGEMWRELSTTGSWQGELLNRKKNGELFWEHAAISAIRRGDGKVTHYVAVKEDMTERKRAESELQDSRAKLASIVNSSMDAIVTVDSQRRVLQCNPAFERMFGWRREELEGGSTEVLHPGREAFEEFGRVVYPSVSRTGSWRGDWVMQGKDGRAVPVELIVSEQRLPSGELVGTVSVLRDMTERMRAEEELRRAKEAAEAATQAKRAFLAAMSHEIRTPLNGVIGMTGLLLDTELTHEQLQFAQTARSSAEALLTLINDILDLSKIEAGRMELERVEFAPYHLVEDVLDIAAAAGQAKGLDLWSLFDPQLPARVVGDPARFRQVMFNLVGNAVKFTERGEVGVSASLRKTDGDTLWVRYEVRDTGIGIDGQVLSGLFTPFTQADATTTRRFGGTGLGLSISKRLVEMMGGSIGVESRPGRGSVFWFTLPFGQTQPQPEADEAEMAALAGTRVFCVESNAGALASMSSVLTRWGLVCEEVSSGAEAVARLRAVHAAGEPPFRLALVDFKLPGMDGLTLAKILREDKRLSSLLLVGLIPLTASAQEQEQARSLFDALLSKPLRWEALRACLISLLDPGAAPSGAVSALPSQAPAVAPPPRRARILVAEDNPVNQQLAVHLLAKMGHRVDLAGNGREAVEMVAKFAYDLIFMDAQMPEMDGFEATAEIRSLPGPESRTPIIAMTAYALAGDRERCLAAGMDDYASKPINTRDLADAVARQLSRAGRPDPSSSRPDHAATSPAVLDMDELLDRLDGDRAIIKELAQSFVAAAPDKLASLQAAVRDRDYPALAFRAHSLKGELGNLSGRAASQAAGLLETAAKARELERILEVWPALREELVRFVDALRATALSA